MFYSANLLHMLIYCGSYQISQAMVYDIPHQVKEPATKVNSLSPMPRIHMVEGESWHCETSSDIYMHEVLQNIHNYTHTKAHTIIK